MSHCDLQDSKWRPRWPLSVVWFVTAVWVPTSFNHAQLFGDSWACADNRTHEVPTSSTSDSANLVQVVCLLHTWLGISPSWEALALRSHKRWLQMIICSRTHWQRATVFQFPKEQAVLLPQPAVLSCDDSLFKKKTTSHFKMCCYLFSLQCKYTYFKLLNSCVEQNHDYSWHSGVKRFFRCPCGNRAISLDKLPKKHCR